MEVMISMTHEQIYEKLITKMKEYHPARDFSIIEKAYKLALNSHGMQLRKSGEPFIIHPMWVAYILAELKLDRETIVAGILHDVLEDTDIIYDELKDLFSEEIADLVDGVTKLDRLEDFKGEKDRERKSVYDLDSTEQSEKAREKNYRENLQAENYRKMFLAMAKDIRVIIIKIADRLHNMRTLNYVQPHKQKRTAQETLDIYAPLTHRLGISKIRYELENLSFKYSQPEAYADLSEKVNSKMTERTEYVRKFVDELKQKLSGYDIEALVEGRPKHLFSIYKKMVGQGKTLDQIFDIFAVRAIVNDARYCYEVLGVVHEMYKPLPGRFKDYIAMPKENNYQSLHTVVLGPKGEPVEIQIRTWEMHRIAEFGIAAHWKYKEGKDGKIEPDKEEEKLSWLRQIMDWERETDDNEEYLSALKSDLDIYTNNVYCFTPQGEIVNLPTGSTPIDFAYYIHSAVGNKMVGARVNGAIVQLNYVISSGDRLEILTSRNSKGPSRDWLKVAKTTQAKSKINQWYKMRNKEDNVLRGRDMLEKDCKRKNISLSELFSSVKKEFILEKYGFKDWDSLCAAVGHGGVKESQVINRLLEEYNKIKNREFEIERRKANYSEMLDEVAEVQKPNKVNKWNSGIVVKGVGDIAVRLSKCCTPVPGDEIVGFVTRGRGISVHRTDCINVINMDELERHRIIESEWQLPDDGVKGISYLAELRIEGEDRIGILGDISKIFSDERVAVKSLNARMIDGSSIFLATVEISGKKQMETLRYKLLKLKGIQNVDRVVT